MSAQSGVPPLSSEEPRQAAEELRQAAEGLEIASLSRVEPPVRLEAWVVEFVRLVAAVRPEQRD